MLLANAKKRAQSQLAQAQAVLPRIGKNTRYLLAVVPLIGSIAPLVLPHPVSAAAPVEDPAETDEQKIRKQIADTRRELAEPEALFRRIGDTPGKDESATYLAVLSELSARYELLSILHEKVNELDEAYRYALLELRMKRNLNSQLDRKVNQNLKRAKEKLSGSYFTLGRLKLRQKNWVDGASNLESAIHLASAEGVKRPRAQRFLARALVMQERFPEARQVLQQGIGLFGTSPDEVREKAQAVRELGAVYYLEGNLAEAQARHKEAMALDNFKVDLFEPTQAPLNAAIARDPKDPKARWKRARYFMERGAFAQAVETRGDAAAQALRPSWKDMPHPAFGGFSGLLEGAATAKTFYADALHDLDLLIRLDPRSATPRLERAYARDSFNSLAAPHERIAQIAIDLDIELAALALQKAAPDADALFGVGQYLAGRAGQEARAIGFLSRSLLTTPRDPRMARPRQLRAELLGKLGKADLLKPTAPRAALLEAKCYDLAVEAADRQTALDPKQPAPYLDRAYCWYAAGFRDKAAAELEKALPLTRLSTEKGRIYALRAQLALDKLQVPEALKDAREATTLAPTDTSAQLTRGIAEIYSGSYADVVKLLYERSDTIQNRRQQLYFLALALTMDVRGDWSDDFAEASATDLLWLIQLIDDWTNSSFAPKKGSKEEGNLANFLAGLQQAWRTKSKS